MNIPDLFSLATPSTKPSSILANAIPQAQDDFQKEFDLVSNSTGEVDETEGAIETDDVTETEDNVSPAETEISAQDEQFTTFLTLLTAQIRNQDPLAPLDSTQFVDQLATFSSLELQAEGNKTLENIASLMASQVYNSDANDSE